jgi:predicted transposase/invertase (TIGR01784 family)
MTKLKYTFKTDMLFKTLFVQYPELLKSLVAELLGIPLENIDEFEVRNPEIPPDMIGDKSCRLDINMTVDGQRVDLEVQVSNEGNYPERAMFNWAREYSTALPAGQDYSMLPCTIVISIINFKLFDCAEYHSKFLPLEAARHELLSDKMVFQFFELPKIPKEVSRMNMLLLWLSLFKADTKEELDKIKAMEVPVMDQAISAYYTITASSEFRERERLYEKARHDEAQAMRHARLEGIKEEREKWQGVVADKDSENARLLDEVARLRAELNKK